MAGRIATYSASLTYPAEKRELAREVYHRFADGDSDQFFSQLFLVLDVYAHYAERIPSRMISASADSLATLQEMREEIGLIAKTIESRDVNITNHAEKTDELCRVTVAKCNETIGRIELMMKNLGAQVDTQAIVRGVQNSIQSGIDQKIISPFMERTKELAREVMPTLEKIRDAADEARTEWASTRRFVPPCQCSRRRLRLVRNSRSRPASLRLWNSIDRVPCFKSGCLIS